MAFFHCMSCRKVVPLLESAERKCSSCGGLNGEVLSRERVEEGLEVGVFYNIDPRTGKRAKKKCR